MMVKISTVAFVIEYLPLKFAWLLYVLVIRYFDKDKLPLDAWQMRDIYFIFNHKGVCLNRARGASKTRDMSLLCVFFALRQNEIKWFAPSTMQLLQAKKYWNSNPFVRPFHWRSKTVSFVYLVTGHSFDINITTSGHVKGGRANIVFFDEMALMTKSIVEDTLPVTSGMDKVADGIYLIFFSTPLINTVFEEYTFSYPTLTHAWTDPSWFNEKFLLKQKLSMSPTRWKTEYLCIFAAMDGQVFELNLVNEPYDGQLRDMQYYGSDPNPREGYAMVGCKYSVDMKHIVINFAKNFGPNNNGKNALFAHLAQEVRRHGVEAELEDNGVGKVVWDDFGDYMRQAKITRTDGTFQRVDWGTSGAGDKVMRANTMNKYTIHIWTNDPRLTEKERKDLKALWSQMNAVAWTKDGSKIDKPTDQAWHMSDSCMHACLLGEWAPAEAMAF
jgi:hypothetical protein